MEGKPHESGVKRTQASSARCPPSPKPCRLPAGLALTRAPLALRAVALPAELSAGGEAHPAG